MIYEYAIILFYIKAAITVLPMFLISLFPKLSSFMKGFGMQELNMSNMQFLKWFS